VIDRFRQGLPDDLNFSGGQCESAKAIILADEGHAQVTTGGIEQAPSIYLNAAAVEMQRRI